MHDPPPLAAHAQRARAVQQIENGGGHRLGPHDGRRPAVLTGPAVVRHGEDLGL